MAAHIAAPAHTRYVAALTAEPRHPIPVITRDHLLLRGDGRLLRAARLDRLWRRRGHAAAGLGHPAQGSDSGLDVDRPDRRRHPSRPRPRPYRLERHGAPMALGPDRHRDRALRLHRPRRPHVGARARWPHSALWSVLLMAHDPAADALAGIAAHRRTDGGRTRRRRRDHLRNYGE